MNIDIDRLRKDVSDEFLAAYFCGGLGAALISAGEVKHASPEQLVKMAEKLGMNMNPYVMK